MMSIWKLFYFLLFYYYIFPFCYFFRNQVEVNLPLSFRFVDIYVAFCVFHSFFLFLVYFPFRERCDCSYFVCQLTHLSIYLSVNSFVCLQFSLLFGKISPNAKHVRTITFPPCYFFHFLCSQELRFCVLIRWKKFFFWLPFFCCCCIYIKLAFLFLC